MFIDFELLSLLGSKNPRLFTFKDHIDQKTDLYSYIKEVSFKNKVACFSAEKQTYKYKCTSPFVFEMIHGAALYLLKIRLAKKLKEDLFKSEIVQAAFRNLIDYLGFLLKEDLEFIAEKKIGKSAFKDLKYRSINTMENGFKFFRDGDLEKALFLWKIMKFHETGNFDVFAYNLVSTDLFKQESEHFADIALSNLSSFVEKCKDIDFFPEYGKEKWISVRADLRIGDKLVQFVGKGQTKAEFEESSTLLKACNLMDMQNEKKLREFFIYSWEDNQLFRLN